MAKRNIDQPVIVLGGGVSGLSTALILLLLGIKVKLLGSEFVGFKNSASDAGLNPVIASNYAMASAYPHNLLVKGLPQISDDSQILFAFFYSHQSIKSYVELHHLYEVFEAEPDSAPLSDRRMNFREFSGTPAELKNIGVPARPGAKHLWGFDFDTYFVDMPHYMSFLWALFKDLGGETYPQNFSKFEEIETHFANEIVVNCLGIGARKIFSDHAPANVVRGQQLIALSSHRPVDTRGHYLAYNYTPTAEVFSRADGTPEYVHFFSRSDGWIFGQTREPGKLSDSGIWEGSAVKGPRIKIQDEEIAEPILTLNDELLFAWQGLELKASTHLSARQGLRYYRDPLASGVNLESEQKGKMLLVHNYGHGGSGVTMSWGCAVEAARQILKNAHFSANNNFAPAGWLTELRKLVLDMVA